MGVGQQSIRNVRLHRAAEAETNLCKVKQRQERVKGPGRLLARTSDVWCRTLPLSYETAGARDQDHACGLAPSEVHSARRNFFLARHCDLYFSTIHPHHLSATHGSNCASWLPTRSSPRSPAPAKSRQRCLQRQQQPPKYHSIL